MVEPGIDGIDVAVGGVERPVILRVRYPAGSSVACR